MQRATTTQTAEIATRGPQRPLMLGWTEAALPQGATSGASELAAGSSRAHVREAEALPLRRLREEAASGITDGIYRKVQVEFAYHSNRIDGGALSCGQIRRIFETGTVGAGDGPVRFDDVIEVANHFCCVDYLLQKAHRPICADMLRCLHTISKRGTSAAAREWFTVGDWKLLPNEAGGRTTTSPEDVSCAIASLLEAYEPQRAHTFDEIVDFHVRFERIHPFQDGNGRVGRLVMFKECLASGIVPFVLTDDMKPAYFRGLAEWDDEPGCLTNVCLAAQDQFKAWLEHFRIPYEG